MTKTISILITLIALLQLSISFASNNKELFTKKTKSMFGEYKLIKAAENDSRCSEGNFTLVGKKIDEGVRLGHHIFIGPFSKEGDISDSKDHCNINVSFKYTENSVTEITKITKCSKKAKGDESIATRVLELKNNKINYKVLESQFNCSYEKIAGGK